MPSSGGGGLRARERSVLPLVLRVPKVIEWPYRVCMGRRALLVGFALLLLAGCGNDAAGTTPAASLDATDWRLVEISSEGAMWAVPDEVRSGLHIKDSAFSVEACNHTGGEVDIGSSTITLRWSREQTAMGCGGANRRLEVAVQSLFDRRLAWEVTDDELILSDGGQPVARWRRDRQSPTADSVELARSEGRSLWHVGYQSREGGPWVSWAGRASEGTAWGTAGLAPSGAPVDGMILTAGDDTVVLGYVPALAASAFFVTAAGEMPLSLVAVGEWQVFGQLSTFGKAPGVIVARDTAGGEVFRSRELPAL